MDLKQLRTFSTVAQLGSPSKAADQLSTAQPALSRQIKLLEQELKTPLFLRHARGMILTSEGIVLLERAERILYDVEDSKLAMQQEIQSNDKINFGMLPSLVDLFATKISRRVAEDHPDCSFRLTVGMSGFVIKWLMNKEIDLGLFYESPLNPKIGSVPILEEPIYLVSFNDNIYGGIGDPYHLCN